MAVTTTPFAGTFRADAAHSSLVFEVQHLLVSRFRALFEDVEATLVDGGRLEASVPVASLSIGEPPELREHVVAGEDFFHGGEHPELSFVSTDVDLRADGTARITGVLTIKGVSREVEATGVYRGPVEDPFGGTRAALELSATLDRRDWGLDWQLALPNGGDALGWSVDVTANLELVQVAAA